MELFFKWIKQHLRIKKFCGTSENAVRIQIYCAIITYCPGVVSYSLMGETDHKDDFEVYRVDASDGEVAIYIESCANVVGRYFYVGQRMAGGGNKSEHDTSGNSIFLIMPHEIEQSGIVIAGDGRC